MVKNTPPPRSRHDAKTRQMRLTPAEVDLINAVRGAVKLGLAPPDIAKNMTRTLRDNALAPKQANWWDTGA